MPRAEPRATVPAPSAKLTASRDGSHAYTRPFDDLRHCRV